MDLETDQIQGNVTPGFRTKHQALVAVRFPDRDASRRWLGALAPGIATSSDVAADRTRHGSWLNVALSFAGLVRLAAPGRESFPEEFRAGMFRRASLLGDLPTTGWDVGGSPDSEAHALLILAADRLEDLARALVEQRALLAVHGLSELATFEGARLPGALDKHEHFGYRDGISQPVLVAVGDRKPDTAPGEFILGYPDEWSGRFDGPEWARNGSYLVFRRLRQHVGGFRRTLAHQAPSVDLTPEQLGSKLIGRWPSGAKLGAPLDPVDPGDATEARLSLDRADFEADPAGARFPLFSHVRKAHPRDVDDAVPRRHRLLRRGIPYGPPLPPGQSTEDGVDRGLLFLAYQASIARQFEHIQRAWFNDPAFPRDPAGPDAVMGHAGRPSGARTVSLARGGEHVPVRLQQFVSMTGGGYFFAPSIAALTELARSCAYEKTAGPTKGDTDMGDDENFRLGAFIRHENPYRWEMQFPKDFQAAETQGDVEKDGIGRNRDADHPFEVPDVWDDRAKVMQGLFWYFDGKPRRVSKAVRVVYTYTVNGQEYKEHLLIGYEGAGGGN
jgi:Dyp-type peroxidase family